MRFEEFIRAHEQDDTAALLLARERLSRELDGPESFDLAVLTLEGRRRLRKKVPEWYAIPSLHYPTRLGPEQCSSSATAVLKASIARTVAAEGYRFREAPFASLTPSPPNVSCALSEGLSPSGPSPFPCPGVDTLPEPIPSSAPATAPAFRIADLTGGLGVDSWAFSQVFGEVLYNEMNPALAEAARHNFAALGCKNITVRCRRLTPRDSTVKPWNDDLLPQALVKPRNDEGSVAEILGGFKPDVIFLDPARRAEDGRKVFRLADCQPDVLQLLPELFEACPRLLLKLSPMADITQLARELPGLRAVHIVGADGECKELLLALERGYSGPYTLTVHDRGAALAFAPAAKAAEARGGAALLFEPGKALAKAGMFREIEEAFGLRQAAPSTHLYFGESIPEPLKPFGKIFVIEEVLPLDGKTYKSLRKRIPQAEITSRNLPLTSDQLRKKLGIASGGAHHLFAIPAPEGIICPSPSDSGTPVKGNLLLVTRPMA